MLKVSHFENGKTYDSLVYCRATGSSIEETKRDRIKQQTPNNIFKIANHPSS